MATFEIESSLPGLTSIEADNFSIKEGFVLFHEETKGHSNVTVFAVDAKFIETIRLVK